MQDQIASGIVVVRVRNPDNLVAGIPAMHLWAAALPRAEAVEAVKREIPAHWTAELTEEKLTQEHVRMLSLKPGGVRQLGT